MKKQEASNVQAFQRQKTLLVCCTLCRAVLQTFSLLTKRTAKAVIHCRARSVSNNRLVDLFYEQVRVVKPRSGSTGDDLLSDGTATLLEAL